MQLADRTLILKQKEFFVFIIATRLLWNHSPSEWFSLYKKPGRSNRSVPVLAFGAYAFQAFVCSRSQSAHGSMPSPLSAEIGNT